MSKITNDVVSAINNYLVLHAKDYGYTEDNILDNLAIGTHPNSDDLWLQNGDDVDLFGDDAYYVKKTIDDYGIDFYMANEF